MAGADRTRRWFLRRAAAAIGGSALLGSACSSDDATDADGVEIVRLFSSDNVIVAGREQRLPLGLLVEGSPVLGDSGSIAVRVLRDGEEIDAIDVPSRVVTHDHVGDASAPHDHADIQRYFPVRTTLPRPGIYDLAVRFDTAEISVPVQAFDPAEVSVILPGERFPAVPTPTLADPGPMETICTLFDGPCPFHTRTAAEVLDAGEPMALLIASPQLCQTSYCGPVLEELIDAAASFPSVVPIHIEVYENPIEVQGDFTDPDVRPVQAIDALGLTFEPALFCVDRAGIVADRIDNVFDRAELELALAQIA